MKLQILSLFVISGLFFSLFHPEHPLTVDSAATLQTVRAMARGGLAIPEMMVTRPGRGGLHYSYYGPLLPVVSLPGYLLGSFFDNPPPPPGSAEVGWGDWLALNTNQWISAGILVVLYLSGIHFGMDWKESYVLAWICGLSTLIFPYARDYFSQPLCAFLLGTAGYCILRYERGGKRTFLHLAAICSALLPWARMDLGIVFVGLGAWALLREPRTGNESLGRGSEILSLSVPFLISVTLLFAFDWYRWGKWGGSPYGDHHFNTPLMDSIPRFLFSPELSVILFNPLLLPSLLFLFFRWKQTKQWAIPLLVIDLLYLVVIGKFRDFHGGVCPGPRYLLSLVPINLIPLFAGMVSVKKYRIPTFLLLSVLAAIGILLNGYEALVDYTTAPSAWDYWKTLLTRILFD